MLISILFTGLSPSMVIFSKIIQLSNHRSSLLKVLQPRKINFTVWPIPFSLAATKSISIDLFSFGY